MSPNPIQAARIGKGQGRYGVITGQPPPEFPVIAAPVTGSAALGGVAPTVTVASPSVVTATRYVHTASAPGGDGTTSATTGTTRAFSGLNEALSVMSATNWAGIGQRPVIMCAGASADVGGGGNPAVSLGAGWDGKTSPTCYLDIIGNQPSSLAYSTGFYRIEPPAGNSALGIASADVYVRISRMAFQVTLPAGAGGNAGVYVTSAADAWFDRCHLAGVIDNGRTSVCYGFRTTAASGRVSYSNCLVHDYRAAGATHQGFVDASTGADVVYYNCASSNVGVGFQARLPDGSSICKNCGATICDDPYAGTFNAAVSTHNAGNAVDAPGTSPRNSVSPTTVSATDWHLAAGDTSWRGFGVDLSADGRLALFTDGDGQTRPVGGAWDIGADQYAVIPATGLAQPAAALVTLGAFAPAITIPNRALPAPGVLTHAGLAPAVAGGTGVPSVSNYYVDTASAAGGTGLTSATTGTDRAFHSLSDAVGALGATNWVTLNRRPVINCVGTAADTATALIGASWSTTLSASCYLEIIGNQPNALQYSTAHYRIEPAAAANLLGITGGNWVRVSRIAATLTTGPGTGGLSGVYVTSVAGDVRLDRLHIRGVVDATRTGAASGVRVNTATGQVTVTNSLVRDLIGAGAAHIGFDLLNTTDVAVFGCAAINCGVGFWSEQTTPLPLVKDCGATGCTDGYLGTFRTGSTNNASSLAADAAGASARNSVTPTFVNAASDWHLGTGDTAWRGFGVDLTSDARFALATDGDGETVITTRAIGPDGLPSAIPSGPLLVRPGLVGFGTTTAAGRGGTLLRVTNLNDTGAGSLRAAVTATGTRTVVFETSGTIALASKLTVTQPGLTIAGQSAPSPGILIKNYGFSIQTHDVLVQHLRVRVGRAAVSGNIDAMEILAPNGYNVVIDHCSLSWALDENGSTWFSGLDVGTHDITWWRCILSEPLQSGGENGLGLLVGDHAERTLILGCLFAHNQERNPYMKGDTTAAVVNNLVYNWGGNQATYLANPDNYNGTQYYAACFLDVVGNVYKRGPSYGGSRPIQMYASITTGTRAYVLDNRDSGVNAGLPPADPWTLVLNQSPDGAAIKATSPVSWPAGLVAVDSSTVQAAVLGNAGAWRHARDAVDIRIVNDVNAGTGTTTTSTSNPDQAGGVGGGYPTIPVTTRTMEAAGMPASPNADSNGNGYTNLEEWLETLALAAEAP
jgi:hypothetical protein